MKYITILFSTPMVQAIEGDRKTMTRRIAKTDANNVFWDPIMVAGYAGFRDEHGKPVKCKYSEGDVLWVRETHYAFGCWQKTGDRTKGGKDEWQFIDKTIENGVSYQYQWNDGVSTIRDGEYRWYKRPSIFMPKDACRTFLKITNVKVERLQDMSAEDAIKEGIACVSKDGGRTYKFGIPDADGYPGSGEIGWKWQDWQNTPTKAFEQLWKKINGKESWEANPFVWCISFEKVDRPADFK